VPLQYVSHFRTGLALVQLECVTAR
jgi:hypothetical protein